MKKYLKLLSIVLIIILCSGCVKYEGKMSIDKYKKMDLSITYATSDNDEKITRATKDILIKNGYAINPYKDSDYKGITVNYQIDNIDKISTTKKSDYNLVNMDEVSPNGMFTIQKGFFKNKYSSNIIYNPSKYLYKYKCANGEELDYESYNDSLTKKNYDSYEEVNCEQVKISEDSDKFSFIVEVEGGVLSNNATEVADDKLIWEFDSDEVVNLEFEFERINYINYVIAIAGIVIVVMALLTSIADGITNRDKRKLKEAERIKAKKEAMAERVVKAEKVVRPRREETNKEMENTDLSNMFGGNNNSKVIPEMKKEDVNNALEDSSFKDLYK